MYWHTGLVNAAIEIGAILRAEEQIGIVEIQRVPVP